MQMSNGAITRTIQSAALAAAVEENGHLRGLEVLPIRCTLHVTQVHHF